MEGERFTFIYSKEQQSEFDAFSVELQGVKFKSNSRSYDFRISSDLLQKVEIKKSVVNAFNKIHPAIGFTQCVFLSFFQLEGKSYFSMDSQSLYSQNENFDPLVKISFVFRMTRTGLQEFSSVMQLSEEVINKVLYEDCLNSSKEYFGSEVKLAKLFASHMMEFI